MCSLKSKAGKYKSHVLFAALKKPLCLDLVVLSSRDCTSCSESNGWALGRCAGFLALTLAKFTDSNRFLNFEVERGPEEQNQPSDITVFRILCMF